MAGNSCVLRTLVLVSLCVSSAMMPRAFSQQANYQGPPVIPPVVGPPVVAAPGTVASEAPPKDGEPGSLKKNVKIPQAPAGAPGAKDAGALRSAYVIGPDDQLFIRVWKQPDLSGAVTVGPDGMISMQLINEVKAAGLTQEQLKGELVKLLGACCINEPEVNVQVLAVRSRTYIIQGEVNRTGVFPLTKPTTILEALVNGGGFGAFANKKKIYVLRGSKRIPFNYNDVSKGKHLEQNIEIQNGDQIFVP